MESTLPRRLPVDNDGSPAAPFDRGFLINSYEAEEERIVNLLSRKLEQLRDEKIQLANALDAEGESAINRLTRQLAALRQTQLQQLQSPTTNGQTPSDLESLSASPVNHLNILDPRNPPPEVTVNALCRENEMLRNRMADMERDYVRLVRLNEIYREELIDHRRRLGISTDNLLTLASDSLSHPTHHRRHRDASISPRVSTNPLPGNRPSPSPLPIPRPPSQIHRPVQPQPTTSAATTSSSPDSSIPTSPFVFSPANPSALSSGNQTGYSTNLTTPASVPPLTAIPPQPFQNVNQLTYPHVPPPSLSSSLGSPTSLFSPASGVPSRRNSVRIAETGSLVRSRRNTNPDNNQPSRPRGESGSGFSVFGIDEVDDPTQEASSPHRTGA